MSFLVFSAQKLSIFPQEKSKSFEHLSSPYCYYANFLYKRVSYLVMKCFDRLLMSVHRERGYRFWMLWSLLGSGFFWRLFLVQANMFWSLLLLILSLESYKRPFLKQFLVCWFYFLQFELLIGPNSKMDCPRPNLKFTVIVTIEIALYGLRAMSKTWYLPQHP